MKITPFVKCVSRRDREAEPTLRLLQFTHRSLLLLLLLLHHRQKRQMKLGPANKRTL
jgi:hypothetical protein